MERRAAAVARDVLDDAGERVAADEERERLVLVRRPGHQLVEQERGRRERHAADAEPAARARSRAVPTAAAAAAWAVSTPASIPCAIVVSVILAGRLARHADLRVPLPERPHVRGLPADERPARRRSARCAARGPSRRFCSRSRCISRDPGSTRRTTGAARGRRLQGRRVGARRRTAARRREKTRPSSSRRRSSDTKKSDSRRAPGSRPSLADEAARRVGQAAGRRQRRRTAREHRDRRRRCPRCRGSRTHRRPSPDHRRAGSAAPCRCPRGSRPSRAACSSHAPRSVARGLTRSLPTNGSLSARARRSSPCRASPGRPAADAGRGRSPSRTGRAGSGGCASRRARGGRPCAACPARSASPLHAAHCFAVLYGQSKLFERIGRGTSTSIPPTASISSSKRSKSTNATWFTSRPVRSSTVRSARAGPPIWFAALIFADPTSGISTWRSRGIERKASRRFPGSVRRSMIESDRFAPSPAAVGRRRRCRGRGSSSGVDDQQPVGLGELAADARRHAFVGRRDAAARPRGSSRPPRRRASTRSATTPSATHRFRLRSSTARRRRRRAASGRRRRAWRRCRVERDPPLDPAAPIDPVRLVLSGHEAGYGSRAVPPDLVIGVDVGGTKMLAGTLARDGTIGRTIEVPTPTTGQEPFLAELDSIVEQLLADGAAGDRRRRAR